MSGGVCRSQDPGSPASGEMCTSKMMRGPLPGTRGPSSKRLSQQPLVPACREASGDHIKGARAAPVRLGNCQRGATPRGMGAPHIQGDGPPPGRGERSQARRRPKATVHWGCLGGRRGSPRAALSWVNRKARQPTERAVA